MNHTARSGDRIRQGAATAPDPHASRHHQSEDDLLAFLLVNTWTLITGRVLRSDVPPSQLSVEELIDFWADDFIACGDADAIRHDDGHRGGVWTTDVKTYG